MNNQEDSKIYKECNRLLDEGRNKEALALADSIASPPLKAAILIDGGLAIRKSGTVRTGTELYEKLLTSGEFDHIYARHSLLYNAANGRSSIYKLRRIRRKTTVPTNDDDLRSAKKLYRETLNELGEEKGSFASQVLVNYGNCLSQFGRFIEAIELYQRALVTDPTNGMAAGNLAVELEHATWRTGNYRHEYIALAYELLEKAFSSDMHLNYGSADAVEGFKNIHSRLRQFIDLHEEPILPPKPITISDDDKSSQEYLQFCFDNGLFLNPWVGNRELSPSITDDIAFGPIVTEAKDNYLVPELLNILDEIKESYSTARFLYFLSQKQSSQLDDLSARTIYHAIDSFEVKGIYTGLCKTAYVRAFDVLDKVARIINVYFGIGKREASFWSIFAEKQSLGQEKEIRFTARKSITDTKNYSLYALADLCIDYFESEHVGFKTIDFRRNKITHDYLNVKLHESSKEIEGELGFIQIDELYAQTKRVLILAKYAILYAVSAVAISENKKREDLDKTVSIEYQRKPGKPFL
ncbi:MAG: LA2681 family HEPN domain-containing protein [Nitrosomonas sp.]|nr:LA2681 family HEPN domain-containing protein [Nitrosomonas sp.]